MAALYPTEVFVASTAYFTSSGTAYIGTDTFTYTGITATSFTGVEGLNSDHLTGSQVTQSLEDDLSFYDTDLFLPQIGDNLYKDIRISPQTLYSQAQLDSIAKAYLVEFYKNHTQASISVLYSPHLKIGDTIEVIDSSNNIDLNYFIQGIQNDLGRVSLTVARYPA